MLRETDGCRLCLLQRNAFFSPVFSCPFCLIFLCTKQRGDPLLGSAGLDSIPRRMPRWARFGSGFFFFFSSSIWAEVMLRLFYDLPLLWHSFFLGLQWHVSFPLTCPLPSFTVSDERSATVPKQCWEYQQSCHETTPWWNMGTFKLELRGQTSRFGLLSLSPNYLSRPLMWLDIHISLHCTNGERSIICCWMYLRHCITWLKWGQMFTEDLYPWCFDLTSVTE